MAKKPAAKTPKKQYKCPEPEDVFRAFVENVEDAGKTVYVGIDPGASGAIALVCGKAVAVVDIPTVEVGVTRTRANNEKQKVLTGKKTRRVKGHTTKFNNVAICRLFKLLRPLKDRIVVCLEHPPSSMGPGKHHAELMLSRAYAMWPLFLCSKGYAVEEVTPSTWKAAVGLSGKEKADSALKALSLYPKADIVLVKHHDRAEAILLAEYARRTRRATH